MNKLKIILTMTGPHPARRVGESSSFQSGFTMVELLVSLLLFATIMAMLVGLNSLPGQTSASRETEARNQVQDGVRSVLAELTTGLRQAGGERSNTGVAEVNCLQPHDGSPWVPCLVYDPRYYEPGRNDSNNTKPCAKDPSDPDKEPCNLLGFRFFDAQGEQCEHVWYEYIPYKKEDPGGGSNPGNNSLVWSIEDGTGVIRQNRIKTSAWEPPLEKVVELKSLLVCSGINKDDGNDGLGGTLDDDDDPELDPSGANPLLSNVLGFNVTVLCRNIDSNSKEVIEAFYPDIDNDPTTYEAPECRDPNTGNLDPAWYPATAIVSIFAASEAENVETSNQTGRIDQTGFRSKISSPDAPRCVEVPDYENPPTDVEVCPLGQVCYCLEERVELNNFRHVNFP